MAKLILHVGTMKSGTTFLQNIFSNNKDYLEKYNIYYPGLRLNQQHAVYGICQTDIPWINTVNKDYVKLGTNLVKKIKSLHRNDKNVLISAEALASLSEEGIQRFINKVGQPDKIIFTIRELSSIIPSAWQQSLKGGSTKTFKQFINELANTRNDLGGFWSTYAYGDAIKRWSKFGNVEVCIVNSHANDKLEIWKNFCTILEIPPSINPVVKKEESNISLDYETAEILRSLNTITHSKGTDYKVKSIKMFLKSLVFIENMQKETKIKIPSVFIDEVTLWNNEEIKKMKAFSHNFVGNIEDLNLKESNFKYKSEKLKISKIAARQIELLLIKVGD